VVTVKYDIAIIGAGPAGATAAHIASKDFETIVIDAGQRAEYRPSAGIFPDHNNFGFDPIPDNVFARDHNTMCYMDHEGKRGNIPGAEFGRKLGKILFLPRYLEYAIGQAEKGSSKFCFQTKATKIQTLDDGVTITCVSNGETQEIHSDVVFLATGGNDFHLHSQLGFQVPRVHKAIQAEFQKDESALSEWEAEYTFHVYSKISQTGPFWVTRRVGEFNVGYIGRDVSLEKFKNILERHKPLQPILQGAKPLLVEGKNQHIFVANIPADASKDLVKNRALVLGDAGGMATPFYYEGVGQARYSALYAVEHLRSLRETKHPPTHENLLPYQERVHQNLTNKLYKSSLSSRTVFFENSSMDIIFTSLVNAINKDRDVREKIAFVYWNNPVNYRFSNDSDVGRKIYDNLPLGKKFTLLPLFLKANFQ
jgi:flavin-dependent dehydrogenase